jgi:large subunit ribosomal protein L15
MALQMRLPKRGFKNPNRVPFVALNLGKLEALAAKHNITTFDIEKLVELDVVRKTDRVKLLATGELNTALTISVHAASSTAKEAVEAKGGTVNLV